MTECDDKKLPDEKPDRNPGKALGSIKKALGWFILFVGIIATLFNNLNLIFSTVSSWCKSLTTQHEGAQPPSIQLLGGPQGLSQVEVRFYPPLPKTAVLSLEHSSSVPAKKWMYCANLINDHAIWHKKEIPNLFLARGPGAHTTLEVLLCDSIVACESGVELKSEQVQKCKNLATKTAWLSDEGIKEESTHDGGNK